MKENRINWAEIAKSQAFVQLHRKKNMFLLSLWVLGTLSYFLLPLGAAYAPRLFRTRLLGRMNFAYFFCLYQFVMFWVMALYYSSVSSTVFDPLIRKVLDLIEREDT